MVTQNDAALGYRCTGNHVDESGETASAVPFPFVLVRTGRNGYVVKFGAPTPTAVARIGRHEQLEVTEIDL
jgi:hypothetical protein